MYNKYICKFCGAHLDPGEKCDCGLDDVVKVESDSEEYIDRRWAEYYCN